jgi:hypothetical protein
MNAHLSPKANKKAASARRKTPAKPTAKATLASRIENHEHGEIIKQCLLSALRAAYPFSCIVPMLLRVSQTMLADVDAAELRLHLQDMAARGVIRQDGNAWNYGEFVTEGIVTEKPASNECANSEGGTGEQAPAPDWVAYNAGVSSRSIFRVNANASASDLWDEFESRQDGVRGMLALINAVAEKDCAAPCDVAATAWQANRLAEEAAQLAKLAFQAATRAGRGAA